MAQDRTQKALISFIITYHNEPVEMLIECIESIRSLSLQEYEREIIVVDDGSEVSPIDYLDYLKSEVVYVRQKNEGLSVARNNGMRISTGHYIQFVDGDDRLLKDAYDQCLELLKAEQPDMLLFHLSAKDRESAITISAEEPVTGASYMHNNNLRASACGYIFSRMTLSTLQFTPGLLHEDEEFTPLLLLHTKRLIATDAQAYYYRQRKDSLTHENEPLHHAQRLADTERILFKLQDIASKLPEFERVALSRRIAQLTMDYLYNIIMLTHSRQQLDTAIADLQSEGLFPLPKKNYSTKYKWFRRIVGTSVGRTFLLNTLPHFKRES